MKKFWKRRDSREYTKPEVVTVDFLESLGFKKAWLPPQLPIQMEKKIQNEQVLLILGVGTPEQILYIQGDSTKYPLCFEPRTALVLWDQRTQGSLTQDKLVTLLEITRWDKYTPHPFL